MGGQIPASLFSQFAGKKVINGSLKNGLEMYMLYDGDIVDMTLKFRIFVWYGIRWTKKVPLVILLRS